MRHKLVLIVLLVATYTYATQIDLQWLSPLLSSTSQAANPQTQITDVRVNSAGDAFVLGNYGSILSSDPTTFLDTTFTGAAYGEGSSYNKNLLLTKVNRQGQLLWAVHSEEGNYDKGVLCPTNDGGVVMAIKFRLTSNNLVEGKESPYLKLIDGLGNADSLKTTYEGANFYYIVLVNIAPDGAIRKMTPLWTSHDVAPANKNNNPTTDVAVVNSIAVDNENNVYIVGHQAMNIALGTDTLYARPCPDWTGDSQVLYKYSTAFILKTDADFQPLGHINSVTTASADRFDLITYSSDKIYVIGSVINNDSTEVQWQIGTASTTLHTHAVTILRFDKTLATDYINTISKTAINEKLSSIAWAADGKTMYLAGSMRGEWTVNDEQIVAGNDKNDGMVLHIEAQSGKVLQMATLNSADNNIFSNVVVTPTGNALVLGYPVSKGVIYLHTYSPTLTPLETISIASQNNSSPIATGMAQYENSLWITFRAARNIDFQIGDSIINNPTIWYATLTGWNITGEQSRLSYPSETYKGAQKRIINGQVYIFTASRCFNVLGMSIE